MNAHTDPKTITNVEPKAYRVDWAVDLAAHSPAEAACFASEIQDQVGHTATVFSVTDKQTGEITVHDVAGDQPGTNVAAKRPLDTTFVPRTLRPGGQYQTRDGQPVEIVRWDRPDTDFPIDVKIQAGRGGIISGSRTKAGLHPQGQGKPHPLDVVEVNPSITKWVRLYDRAKLNPAGKQVVLGKEFAAERGLFMYIYDTEAEAKASLQGVRAVFPMSYREGEGLG